jgi:hypothetical protein
VRLAWAPQHVNEVAEAVNEEEETR